MRNRQELARYFASLGFKRGAEIGVCQGRYAQMLCQTIPGLELTVIDPWPGDNNPNMLEAIDRLDGYDVEFVRATSLDAPKQIYDFVFIDGLHDYQSVKADIEAWAPYARIVSGHDYHVEGVARAVNEYADTHKLDLNFTWWDLDNPIKDDRQPCWWYQ